MDGQNASNGRPRPESVALQKIDEELTCDVCLDQYRNPKTLPCLHSFCLECIQRLPTKDKGNGFVLDCPVCRKSHEMTSNSMHALPDAFHIKRLFAIQRQIASTPGVNPLSPMSPNFPPTSPQSAEKCQEHDDFLRVFCETCNKVICRDCTVTLHKDHDYQLIHDYYTLATRTITARTAGIGDKVKMVEPAVNSISAREEKIRRQGEEIREKISEHTNTVIEKIKLLETKLHEKVDESVDQKCQWLKSQREDITEAAKQLEGICAKAEHMLKNSSPVDVLLGQKTLLKELEDANVRVERLVLTPVEDVNITFTENDESDYQLGHVESTSLSNSCSVSLSAMNSASPIVAGMDRKLFLTINTHKENIRSIPSCLLRIETESSEQQKVHTSLESVDQSEYAILFCPKASGKYNVRVFVCDKEIRGSPIPVSVSYSPSLDNRAVQIISKLNKPHGCCHIDDEMIVVAEYSSHCVTFLYLKENRRKSIGKKGPLPGQFMHPRGVALSADRLSILVTDNHRIQKLSFEGAVLAVAGSTKHGPSRLEFYNPSGIAVNPTNGHIYIADTDNNRIQVLNDDLQILMSFGRSSSAVERLNGPLDVALDNAGDVYVVDSMHNCIKKFTAKGRLTSQIGTYGVERGKLNWPTSLAINSYEYLYITEQENKRVSVFMKTGESVSCSAADFKGPQYVNVDHHGNVYVSDTYNDKLHIFFA